MLAMLARACMPVDLLAARWWCTLCSGSTAYKKKGQTEHQYTIWEFRSMCSRYFLDKMKTGLQAICNEAGYPSAKISLWRYCNGIIHNTQLIHGGVDSQASNFSFSARTFL